MKLQKIIIKYLSINLLLLQAKKLFFLFKKKNLRFKNFLIWMQKAKLITMNFYVE